ncbi:putative disease resistance RPP13-like protein 1 [Cannabis sativa]|uniref:putative disease resistance RPP13-like protein 1 n=1 Tax=Cannabis sativa TaxID=3483 RepID=UPI0029CA8952|nr:putative disease resistance RPP13-like protein 1 [Cannabis sativa]
MAQGFLPLDRESKKMEAHGEEYLEDLSSRSLFQHSNKEKSLLQMHDLVHDLAILVSNDFCFRLDLHNDLLKLSTKTRHLSYTKKVTYDINKVKELHEVKSLRTFLALPFKSHRYYWKIKCDMLLTSRSFLRVLSLRVLPMKKLLHSIGNLKHLRYLDLSHTGIQELPDSVCNLYNLQTLLLFGCERLHELPKKMGRLINLRYLDIEGVPLKELPQELNTIKHLYFLSDVILSSDRNSTGGLKMKKVGELENLHSISGLENIKDAGEASEANLKDKKSLSKLTLRWKHKRNGGVAANSQKENDILDALRPHTNLQHLSIEYYRGTILSDWIGDSAFLKLISIRIDKCNTCCILPSLGQLPFLKDLLIRGCNGVISIGDEIPHDDKGLLLFRCLEVLFISDMLEWKDWSFSSEAMQQGQIFPLLKKLSLYRCPMLNIGLPCCYLPSMESLEIFKCERMVGLVPRTGTTQQTVEGTAPSLVEISIHSCSVLESLLDWGSHSKVKSLTVPNSKKLIENHKQWDLQRLSCLKYLNISGWEDGIFPEDIGILPITLTTLMIFDCSKLESLNSNAFQELTSLSYLYIRNCEGLRCLPEEGLPISITYRPMSSVNAPVSERERRRLA